MKPNLQYTLLPVCCANLMLLAACGGGGSGGMVRSDSPRPVVQQPTPATPCPAPLSADCVVVASDFTDMPMAGGRQSDYALINRGTEKSGALVLSDGEFRFSGGTTIEGGAILLRPSAVLQSNVTVQSPGSFGLFGTVVGNVTNQGDMNLWGFVTGDLANHGNLVVESSVYSSGGPYNRIEGNFRQSATGTLSVAIPYGDFFGSLQILGRADLAGALQLHQYGDAWGPYPLPAAPLSALILHADGGVFGQFEQWTAPGLFVEGSVRYGSHDVWFDLTRVSLQSAMAANAAADPMTLATAANIDAALSRADAFAMAPIASLEASQQRFLSSAASLLHARDVAGATRSLDSLSGHAHALAHDMLHEQSAAALAHLDARLERLPRGLQAGPWSAPLSQSGQLGGRYGGDGQASGYDHWLAPHWLIGGGVTTLQSQMQFERMGGHSSGDSPMASLYAHYRGGEWHATGVVGAGRSTLQFDRSIDLGTAGTHFVHSRREIDQAFLHGEFGRRVAFGNGQLTPFAALDYSALHSEGFTEQGDTGFELAAQAGRATQWSTAAGARYAHDWHPGAGGWLRLNLDARYQRRLAAGGDALQVAFVGTPDASFHLAAASPAAGFTALRLGLAGGVDDRWSWSLDYAHRFGSDARQGGWFAGLRREF